MQFILLLYSDEAGWANLSRQEQQDWMAAYNGFVTAMQAQGVMCLGNHLRPSNEALTVHVNEVDVNIQNQPFSKEDKQLSGFFVIEANDMEEAVIWAARCPAARHGVVEVRPIGATPPIHMN